MWLLRNRNERGTTLASVLVSVALLAVLSFLTASTISRAAQARLASDTGATEAFLAFQKEQEIMGKDFNSVVSEANTHVDASKYPGFFRAVNITPMTGNIKKVTVTVTYTAPGAPGSQKSLVFYRTIDQPAN
ncbi:MAG: hypothetical protein K6T65_08980 [Peptococcaceae bacterium]|nr:hypothetical protein [Peptococcaceae bacterium]